MTEEAQPILKWCDLTAEDVYHIAHLENEARDMFAIQIAKIAFTSTYLTSEVALNADSIVKDNEKHAQNWLENQAIFRGLVAEILITDKTGIRVTELAKNRVSGDWIRQQLKEHPEVNGVALAAALGISQGYLSAIKKGRQQPSQVISDRLSIFFADAKGLTGEEKERFIATSTATQSA